VSESIPLTKAQLELLTEFYSFDVRKVAMPKIDRDAIYQKFKKDRYNFLEEVERQRLPALNAEIEKSLSSGKLIQPAIFSECVYAQALADQFDLGEFTDYSQQPKWLTEKIIGLIASYNLKVRYVYRNSQGSRLLIQAGGPSGVDSALISVLDTNVFTLEFKEPGAKSSEADLPRYGEDGLLLENSKMLEKWPQFGSMLEEQIAKQLNFFEHVGKNINDFSKESIREAINGNYNGKKFADVICTEDQQGYLTMIPANQVHLWAHLEGEIRPSGRNSYKVWTPNRLMHDLVGIGGVVNGATVTVSVPLLGTAGPRGGIGISRYKINSLFFVRKNDVTIENSQATFRLDSVRQNKPTIAAKMFFKNLSIDNVKIHYLGEHH
jgi:hypothetical protein